MNKKEQTHNPESRWFGTKSVNPDEKQNLVDEVFHSVASRYDIMNDAMSGGMHRLWKDRLIREISPQPDYKVLDVAGGTGDIAFRLHKSMKRKDPSVQPDITICDINPSMLSAGRDRALDLGFNEDAFNWQCGNAEILPFSDNSFDLYTISFGLRNVAHIDKALHDAHRILKPGGRFFCMEFSHVDNPIIGGFYKLYSNHIIPRLGQAIAGDKDSYQYLIESIRKFPRPQELERRMKEAGFIKTKHHRLTHGVVCIHSGVKSA